MDTTEHRPVGEAPENPEIMEVTEAAGDAVPEEKYILHIENFEGPLDLLWTLIRKSKIDIMDVSISSITEQYIAYLRMMERLNVSIATDFINMASELLYYKSKALLPTGEMEDEFFIPPLPPELIQKLLEYKKYQQASSSLRQMYDLNQDSYTREVDASAFVEADEWVTLSLYDLLNAFAGVMGRNEKIEEKTIHFDEVLVGDRIRELIALLDKSERIDFFSLFTDTSSRGEIIATFLAILELTKIQKIRIMQRDNYADIAIFRLYVPGSYAPEEFVLTSVKDQEGQ